MRTIVIVTGGFDPCHEGHISYLKDAKKLGDLLVVGINSDEWLIRKKGFRFMSWKTRADILSQMRFVDHVFSFDDSDGTATHAIEKMTRRYPLSQFIFANGGDRTKENIPEMKKYKPGDKNYKVEFVFGIGGEDKKNSSRDILKEYENYIVAKHNLTFEKWIPKEYELTVRPSLSEDANTPNPSKKIQLVNSKDRLRYSTVGDERDEWDEILYSSRPYFYSDIYDYPTWGDVDKKEDK